MEKIKNEEITLRDHCAIKFCECLLKIQGRRRITLFSRLLFFLGLKGWTANYDYNYEGMSRASFELTDIFLNIRDYDYKNDPNK